jgi:hypothetical protein
MMDGSKIKWKWPPQHPEPGGPEDQSLIGRR